jgi:acetylornithine deacetylase/succinyl-diaminopimelate desuccinylase-like protein
MSCRSLAHIRAEIWGEEIKVSLIVVGMLATAPAWAQSPGGVPSLARRPAVRSVLEAVKASEPQTILDQIRFCEVPAPPFKEADRAGLLRAEFVRLGLQSVRLDRVGNVLGERRGEGSRPRVVVAAHLDTVFPEGTDVKVTRQGNLLRGPGIGDNCRGLAVLAAIIRAMQQTGVQTTGPVTFVANVGEEGLGDLRGMKALFGETMKDQIERFLSIDNAGIHVSAIGTGSHRFRVTFRGPGGHSFAQFGIANPADALGRAIAKIADWQVAPLPRTTFNVGRIGGGTSVNSIPTEAWMEVDLRSSDSGALAALDTKLQQAVEAAAAEENARWGTPRMISVTRELVGDRPAGALAMDAPILTTAQAVARVLGVVAAVSESSSDANLPISLRIPAISIGGGGRSVDSHTPSETFDATDSWKGTQFGLLLTLALAEP